MAPVQAVNSGYHLRLFPTARLQGSKTYAADESVDMVIPWAPWFNVVCAALKEREPMELVCPWSFHGFLMEFRRSLRYLSLPRLVPYQMRHSGPVTDLARGYHTKAEVKHRHRWASDSSVNRYALKAQLAMHRKQLPTAVRSFLMDSEQHIESIVCGRLRPTGLGLPPIRGWSLRRKKGSTLVTSSQELGVWALLLLSTVSMPGGGT